MNPQNQCVISLQKLTLPENTRFKKLTLSVLTSSQEIFIQNYKNVKTNKINFYRQCIFLTSLPQQLSFNLYQVDDSANKVLIKQLKTPSSDLREINLRTSIFRSSDQGFILDWESWIFTEDSQELNEFTQRDYSQLNFPFENEEQTNGSRMLKNSSIYKEKQNVGYQSMKRRSSSTDGSSSPDPIRPSNIDMSDLNKKASRMDNKCKSPQKQRNTIKSHLYTELVKIASELFSQSSS